MNLPVFWVTYSKHLFLCFQHFEKKRRGHRQKNPSPTAEITALGFGAQSMTLSRQLRAFVEICPLVFFPLLKLRFVSENMLLRRVFLEPLLDIERTVYVSVQGSFPQHINFQVSKTHPLMSSLSLITFLSIQKSVKSPSQPQENFTSKSSTCVW